MAGGSGWGLLKIRNVFKFLLFFNYFCLEWRGLEGGGVLGVGNNIV